MQKLIVSLCLIILAAAAAASGVKVERYKAELKTSEEVNKGLLLQLTELQEYLKVQTKAEEESTKVRAELAALKAATGGEGTLKALQDENAALKVQLANLEKINADLRQGVETYKAKAVSVEKEMTPTTGTP